jgi:ankyrin repeat protein
MNSVCLTTLVSALFCLSIVNCTPTMKSTNNPMMAHAPEELYSGPSLEIAKVIRTKDAARLKELLRSPGFLPHDKGLKDVPLIVWAASHDNMAAVRDLLAAGAPANDSFKSGQVNYNLVSLATGSANPEFLLALLDAGGNPNGLSGTEPPLFTAIHGKRWERLDRLIRCGAHIDQTNGVGATPLITLASVREYDQVLKLLKLGANPDHKTGIGMSLRSIISEYPLDPSSEKGQAQRRVIQYLDQQR